MRRAIAAPRNGFYPHEVFRRAQPPLRERVAAALLLIVVWGTGTIMTLALLASALWLIVAVTSDLLRRAGM